MREIIHKTDGVSVYERGNTVALMLPTLDVIDVTRDAYILWNLIGKGKSVDELNSGMKKIYSDITEEKIEKILKTLSELQLIHSSPCSAVEKNLSFEENLLMKYSGDRFLLLRKGLIEKDENLHYITFLPGKETFTVDSLLAALDKILPPASRSPIMRFFDAEQYLDIISLRKIVEFITSRIVYDRPFIIVEVDSDFITEDIHGLLTLLEATPYQCLHVKTQEKRFLKEKTTLSGAYDFSIDDTNLFVLLRIDTLKDIEHFAHLTQYPGKSQGVSFKISKKNQVQLVEKFLKTYPVPVFLRFESCNLIPYFFLHFLDEERVLFVEDDLYRLKRAFIKNCFPITTCGAGKRKITITPDGTVYPCLPAVKEGYSIGNIKEGIQSVMKGEKIINLQNRTLKRFNECKNTCSFAYFCGGCFLKRRCRAKHAVMQSIFKGVNNPL